MSLPSVSRTDRRYLVEVGFTSTRPVRPDEHTAWVAVLASSDAEAALIAAQIVACVGSVHPYGPACVMPTSTLLLDWEE